MKKKLVIWIPIIFIVGYIGLTFYQALGILGPRDKPKFNKMEWTSLDLTYWIKTGAKETEKQRIEGISGTELSELFSKLEIGEIRGSSTAIGSQGRLIGKDGEKWDFSFVFEDRVAFGLRKNNYYSYYVDLKGYEFYTFLRELCREHAETDYPNIKESSIKLRSNLALSAYTAYKRTNVSSE